MMHLHALPMLRNMRKAVQLAELCQHHTLHCRPQDEKYYAKSEDKYYKAEDKYGYKVSCLHFYLRPSVLNTQLLMSLHTGSQHPASNHHCNKMTCCLTV
jgi:hypothetical protein